MSQIQKELKKQQLEYQKARLQLVSFRTRLKETREILEHASATGSLLAKNHTAFSRGIRHAALRVRCRYILARLKLKVLRLWYRR